MSHIEAGNASLSAHSEWNQSGTNDPPQTKTLTRIDAEAALNGYQNLDAQQCRRVFDENQRRIEQLAPTVAERAALAKLAWEQLVPWLCKQRALLSQRGSDRRQVLEKANLPEWQTYFRQVVASIDSSVSTVYRRMREFEGAKVGTGRRPKLPFFSPVKQKRIDATELRMQIVTLRTQVATGKMLAKEILAWPGLLSQTVEKLACEVLGPNQKPATAKPRMDEQSYGLELEHWKNSTGQLLRAVGVGLGSEKERKTRQTLVRYVQRLRGAKRGTRGPLKRTIPRHAVSRGAVQARVCKRAKGHHRKPSAGAGEGSKATMIG